MLKTELVKSKGKQWKQEQKEIFCLAKPGLKIAHSNKKYQEQTNWFLQQDCLRNSSTMEI